MTLNTQTAKIASINTKIQQMGKLVENQIQKSMNLLKDFNKEDADKIILDDNEIDEFQKEIDEESVKFIATEQPLAEDLRKILAVTKIVSDLERIADYAVDICKSIKKSNEQGLENTFINCSCLWEMDNIAREMLNKVIDCYLKGDVDYALEIAKIDDKVDKIYKEAFTKIVEGKSSALDDINKKARILFVAKYLERVGDHITNICEWIIFSKEGKYLDLN